MIDYKSDTKKTDYKVLNYGLYQDFDKPKPNTDRTPIEHQSNTDRTPIETNNKDNNINNINKDNNSSNSSTRAREYIREKKDEVLAAYCELIDPLPTTYQMSCLDAWQQKMKIEPEVLISAMHIARIKASKTSLT